MPGTVSVSIKQPTALASFVDKDGKLLRQGGMQQLLQVANSFLLITQDTSSGNVTVPLPPASAAPNSEIAAIKISADGNTFALSANGSDTINKSGAWAAANLTVGSTQGSKVLLKSDGNAAWYVIA